MMMNHIFANVIFCLILLNVSTYRIKVRDNVALSSFIEKKSQMKMFPKDAVIKFYPNNTTTAICEGDDCLVLDDFDTKKKREEEKENVTKMINDYTKKIEEEEERYQMLKNKEVALKAGQEANEMLDVLGNELRKIKEKLEEFKNRTMLEEEAENERIRQEKEMMQEIKNVIGDNEEKEESIDTSNKDDTEIEHKEENQTKEENVDSIPEPQSESNTDLDEERNEAQSKEDLSNDKEITTNDDEEETAPLIEDKDEEIPDTKTIHQPENSDNENLNNKEPEVESIPQSPIQPEQSNKDLDTKSEELHSEPQPHNLINDLPKQEEKLPEKTEDNNNNEEEKNDDSKKEEEFVIPEIAEYIDPIEPIEKKKNEHVDKPKTNSIKPKKIKKLQPILQEHTNTEKKEEKKEKKTPKSEEEKNTIPEVKKENDNKKEEILSDDNKNQLPKEEIAREPESQKEEPTTNSNQKDLEQQQLSSSNKSEDNSIPLQEPINVDDLNKDTDDSEKKEEETPSTIIEDVPVLPLEPIEEEDKNEDTSSTVPKNQIKTLQPVSEEFHLDNTTNNNLILPTQQPQSTESNSNNAQNQNSNEDSNELIPQAPKSLDEILNDNKEPETPVLEAKNDDEDEIDNDYESPIEQDNESNLPNTPKPVLLEPVEEDIISNTTESENELIREKEIELKRKETSTNDKFFPPVKTATSDEDPEAQDKEIKTYKVSDKELERELDIGEEDHDEVKLSS